MKKNPRDVILWLAVVGWLGVGVPAAVSAQKKEAPKTQEVNLAGGSITMKAPASWTKQQPRVRIIEAEYSIAAKKDDETPARLTIMAAGGSLEANIDRWLGQFTKKNGEPKNEKMKVGERDVHYVDISGTFKDQRGPFAPATMRENYRMLGAIMMIEKKGQYFVKMYGPKATMDAHEEGFKKMIKSLEVK